MCAFHMPKTKINLNWCDAMIIEFDVTYKTNLADAIVTNILHQNVICLVQITLNNAITQILRSLLHVKDEIPLC